FEDSIRLLLSLEYLDSGASLAKLMPQDVRLEVLLHKLRKGLDLRIGPRDGGPLPECFRQSTHVILSKPSMVPFCSLRPKPPLFLPGPDRVRRHSEDLGDLTDRKPLARHEFLGSIADL